MPDLRVLEAGESTADPDNNIVLAEVTRAGGGQEYTLTVTIDGKPLSTSGPFLDRGKAVDQAVSDAEHYALNPIYEGVRGYDGLAAGIATVRRGEVFMRAPLADDLGQEC